MASTFLFPLPPPPAQGGAPGQSRASAQKFLAGSSEGVVVLEKNWAGLYSLFLGGDLLTPEISQGQECLHASWGPLILMRRLRLEAMPEGPTVGSQGQA